MTTTTDNHIGYVRISTIEQQEDRQSEALKSLNIDKLFIEKQSSNGIERPQLKAMLDYVRVGDIVYLESFSHLARNTIDLLRLLEDLTNKGVGIVSLKECIDTSTASGKLMVPLIGAVANFEEDILLEKQREGITIATAQGKCKGRQPKTLPKDFDNIYKQYMSRKITKSRMAELCNLSRPVMDRLLREYEDQL